MNNLKIVVNDIEFMEIPNQFFIVHGEEDPIPFMESVETNTDPLYPRTRESGRFPFRTYKALVMNQRFFAPRFEDGKPKKYE